MVNGHGAKTSGPDELASHVVNIASPAQLAGVHAGYSVDATTVSSSTLAAAVDAGAGVGVAVATTVGAMVAVFVALAAGLAGAPHAASTTTTMIGAVVAILFSKLTRKTRRRVPLRPDGIKSCGSAASLYGRVATGRPANTSCA
jgi:hypothetical protein